jgi:hypothetical protein
MNGRVSTFVSITSGRGLVTARKTARTPKVLEFVQRGGGKSRPAPYFKKAIASALASVLAAGCQNPAVEPRDRVLDVKVASNLINGTIKLGMKRKEVVGWLGSPQRTETYGDTDFLFYNAPWYMAGAAFSTNPVAIKDGRVCGLGKTYYATFSSKR